MANIYCFVFIGEGGWVVVEVDLRCASFKDSSTRFVLLLAVKWRKVKDRLSRSFQFVSFSSQFTLFFQVL